MAGQLWVVGSLMSVGGGGGGRLLPFIDGGGHALPFGIVGVEGVVVVVG